MWTRAPQEPVKELNSPSSNRGDARMVLEFFFKERKELHQGNSTADRPITLIVSLSEIYKLSAKMSGLWFQASHSSQKCSGAIPPQTLAIIHSANLSTPLPPPSPFLFFQTSSKRSSTKCERRSAFLQTTRRPLEEDQKLIESLAIVRTF